MIVNQIAQFNGEYYVYLSTGLILSVGTTFPTDFEVGDSVRLILVNESRSSTSTELEARSRKVDSADSDLDRYVHPSDGKSGWHI